MVGLFLRLYGVLIATLICSFLVQGQLMDYVWREMSQGYDFKARYRPMFHLIEESLSPWPPERWPERFSELSAGFAVPARLERPERVPAALSLPPTQANAFAQGGIVATDRPGGGFHIAKTLRGGAWAAVLELPGPDQARVRMVTYLVNWGVEFAIVAVLVFFWVRPFWR